MFTKEEIEWAKKYVKTKGVTQAKWDLAKEAPLSVKSRFFESGKRRNALIKYVKECLI